MYTQLRCANKYSAVAEAAPDSLVAPGKKFITGGITVVLTVINQTKLDVPGYISM
jgi:hypothetical protein